ncbi:amino acid ABC transporter substrate-binding protein [Methylopila turkensis]|uniref:Amino acid ABC transporter substrate-binding protein n=1 Tax=Methylopila turkensis TaxID=1437816 RepID=A0A9W6N8R2_9HYPH|nr:amino acid ABC transporter substrate-binding protein [Methylopila turkensis]
MVTGFGAAGGSPVRPSQVSRRGVLMGAAAICVSGAASAQAAPARVAAVDWAMLETTLALGLTPVAAAELVLFRSAAVEPAVPDSVADLGLRGSISYERLLATRPDLVLISPWYENRRAPLERVAPVESLAIYGLGSPYEAAVAATRALGLRLGRSEAAERAVAETEAELAAARAALAPLAGRPALVMNLGDPRHFRAFGHDSMFGDVLARIGLTSAWTEPTRFGAYPTVGVEALAGMDDAFVINVGPTPPAVLAGMRASALWSAMPPIAAGRFVALDPVNPYGALPAARRFARLAAGSLAAFARG